MQSEQSIRDRLTIVEKEVKGLRAIWKQRVEACDWDNVQVLDYSIATKNEVRRVLLWVLNELPTGSKT